MRTLLFVMGLYVVHRVLLSVFPHMLSVCGAWTASSPG